MSTCLPCEIGLPDSIQDLVSTEALELRDLFHDGVSVIERNLDRVGNTGALLTGHSAVRRGGTTACLGRVNMQYAEYVFEIAGPFENVIRVFTWPGLVCWLSK